MKKHPNSLVAVCATGVAALVLLSASNAGAALIVNVVEKNGDNEATDTITAKWTGQTFPVSVANEPVPGLTVGQNYTVGLFGVNAPMFVDRTHRWVDASLGATNTPMPSYLQGWEYIMSGNDNRDNNNLAAPYTLEVTVSAPVQAYLLIDDRLYDGDNMTPPTFFTNMLWVANDGWTPVTTGANRFGDITRPDQIGVDEGSDGSIQQYSSIYTKLFPAGTFSLYQPDNPGRNMYGVVIAVPEPSTFALIGLGLLGLVGWRLRRHRS
jgi:hypothetical protein